LLKNYANNHSRWWWRPSVFWQPLGGKKCDGIAKKLYKKRRIICGRNTKLRNPKYESEKFVLPTYRLTIDCNNVSPALVEDLVR